MDENKLIYVNRWVLLWNCTRPTRWSGFFMCWHAEWQLSGIQHYPTRTQTSPCSYS